MSRFNAFIRERKFLLNISPATVSWYTSVLKWLSSESPGQAELKEVVVRMRERGLRETGGHAVIRAVNSCLRWDSAAERKCVAGCNHPHLRQLKEPQIILPTLTESQVKLLVEWKPRAKHYHQRRCTCLYCCC
jgi:integrase/recombinase XerD